MTHDQLRQRNRKLRAEINENSGQAIQLTFSIP